jgi:hypothetical protein
MNYKKTITIVLCILLCSAFHGVWAQGNIQISLFGDPGISSAYGDYPSEYNPTVDFSFHAGARVRINEAFGTPFMMAFDCGFLDIAYNGHVDATDTYFYTSYNFLAFNALTGVTFGSGYLAGGLYYAKSLGGDSYQEYADRWISLDQKDDLGLVAELGKDLGEYITVGIQGRFGIPSIGSSVDIKTWALHGKLAINLFSF